MDDDMGTEPQASGASERIAKQNFVDPRIMESATSYGIYRGADQANVMPFPAVQASSSLHQYNIQVPNQGVWVQRNMRWQTSVFVEFDVVNGPPAEHTGTNYAYQGPATHDTPANGIAAASALRDQIISAAPHLLTPGVDFDVADWPLNRLLQSMTVQINNQNLTLNTDVLEDVLKVYSDPTDTAVSQDPKWAERLASLNIGDEARGTGAQRYAGSGSFANLVFVGPDGNEMFPTDAAVSGNYCSAQDGDARCKAAFGDIYNNMGVKIYTAGSANTLYVAGRPTVYSDYPASDGNSNYVLPTINQVSHVRMRLDLSEQLLISPFIANEWQNRESGIFGISNIILQMAIASPSFTAHIGRILRPRNIQGPVRADFGAGAPLLAQSDIPNIQNIQFYTPTGFNSPFSNSKVVVEFMDPNYLVSLPKRSIVPYHEITRFQKNVPIQLGVGTPGGVAPQTTFMTDSVTLPSIPDLLLISVRPATYCPGDLDWALPIEKCVIQWGTRGGLLSNYNADQLYDMAIHNGLASSWSEFRGSCSAPAGDGSGAGATVAGTESDITTLAYNITNGTGRQALLTAPSMVWTAEVSASSQNGLGGYGGPSGPWRERRHTAGSVLVLRPGIDFPLDPTQAPGMLGSFVCQFNITVANRTGWDLSRWGGSQAGATAFAENLTNAQTIFKGPNGIGTFRYVITCINSGFFASVFGNSSILRGILSPTDVAKTDADIVPMHEHVVGKISGSGFFDNLGSNLGRFGQTLWKNRGTIASAGKDLYGLYNKYKGAGGNITSGNITSGNMTGGAVTGGGFPKRRRENDDGGGQGGSLLSRTNG